MGFEANFILFLTVKEFGRSVKFSPSYSKLNLACFLGNSVACHLTITLTNR